MIRRKGSRPRKRTRPNIPRDRTKLLIAIYLNQKRSGATPNELSKKATSRTQAADIFKDYLEEMLEMKWVNKKRVDLGGGMSVYTITSDGIKAVEEARKILESGHPLSKLDAFDFED